MRIQRNTTIWFNPQYENDAAEAILEHDNRIADGDKNVVLAAESNLIHADVLMLLTQYGFKIESKQGEGLNLYYTFKKAQ